MLDMDAFSKESNGNNFKTQKKNIVLINHRNVHKSFSETVAQNFTP